MGKRYRVGIVGEASYREAIAGVREGDPVEISHDKDNSYDTRAMMVRSGDGQKLGYLARGHWLTDAMLDEERTVSAWIDSINGGTRDAPSLGVVLMIEMYGAREQPRAAPIPDRPNPPVPANRSKPRLLAGCLTLAIAVLLVGYCADDAADVAPAAAPSAEQ